MVNIKRLSLFNYQKNCLPEAVSLRTDLLASTPIQLKFSLEVPLIDDITDANFLKEAIILDIYKFGSYVNGLKTAELGCVTQIVHNFTMMQEPVQALNYFAKFARKHSSSLEPNTRSQYCIKINDGAFFSNQLINQITLQVSSVGFGTLLPNLKFINHWVVNYEDECTEFKEKFQSHFKASFNFDEIQLVNVQIWSYNFGNNNSQSKKKAKFEYYSLVIETKQLQRLIVSHSIEKTTIFFELSYPASIRKKNCCTIDPADAVDRFTRIETIYRGKSSDFYPEKGVQADNRFIQVDFPRVSIEQLYSLLSRIYQRTRIFPEFADLTVIEDIIPKKRNHYHSHFHTARTHPFDQFSYFGKHLLSIFPKVDNEVEKKHNEKCQFQITFLMYGIFSFGAYVKDQIFQDKNTYKVFCNDILNMIRHDYANSLIVLESIIRHLNMKRKHADLFTILKEFKMALKEGNLGALPYDANLSIHYEKIGVIVITPSRVIFKCPELHMGNTVTRFINDNTRMVRVILRENDGSMFRFQSHDESRIKNLVSMKMSKGITCCDRIFKFFGASGSQQREMGMYFMDAHLIELTSKSLVTFLKEENRYKKLAREGQNLTQSMRCNVHITKEMWCKIKDFKYTPEGRKEAYIFSDGCGMISLELWREMCSDLKIDNPPCAFQYRFLGFKGMLTVNPASGRKIYFRDSQEKFGGRESGHMEIVKLALPQATNLSRPFINILCQNSASNPVTHKRILNRLLNLYEDMFIILANSLTDEKVFRNVIKELPSFLDVDLLSEEEGFVLHQEPFFKSLVMAYVKQRLEQQIKKISLPMPPSLGRSLFGVVDEIGILEPGQVFVQWSNSLKSNSKNIGRTILKGKVTVTKNPCIASGDVRMFEAINSPKLADLYWDVIVFPNRGTRPHPDEMAGSDLDGDEYSVLCDDELLLDRNEEAFDFETSGNIDVSTKEWDKLDTHSRKIQYVLDFFAKNKIGLFADAQMNISDLHGINSLGCIELIKKTCAALDFAKSGIPPENLTTDWKQVGKELVPPEKASRRADFKAKEEYGPTYASSRMNGILHRNNRQLSSLLTTEEIDEQIAMNPVFVKEFERCAAKREAELLQRIENQARKTMNIYNSRLKGIMDSYGIKTEGELFSGCILNMINKLNEREEDDGSNFTTVAVVGKIVILLFREFREKFFQEFDGGWEEQTEYKGSRAEWESMNVLNRTVKVVSNIMKLKALMYFKLAYEKAIQSGEKLFSFGWLAWDVLAKVQQKANWSSDFDVKKDGIAERIRKGIKKYKVGRETEFEKMLVFDHYYMPWLQINMETLYDNYKHSIFNVFLVLKDWAEKNGLIKEKTSKSDISKFILLIIYAALGNDHRETLFDGFGPIAERPIKLHEGELLINILRRLTMRKTIEVESKKELEIGNKAIHLEWNRVHETARKSFYTLCIHQNVAEILEDPAHMKYLEKETMIIELPVGIDDQAVLKKLVQKTEAVEMTLKRKNQQNPTFVTVLYRGNADSEEKLRCLVQLEPQKVLKQLGPEMDVELAKEVYKNIMI